LIARLRDVRRRTSGTVLEIPRVDLEKIILGPKDHPLYAQANQSLRRLAQTGDKWAANLLRTAAGEHVTPASTDQPRVGLAWLPRITSPLLIKLAAALAVISVAALVVWFYSSESNNLQPLPQQVQAPKNGGSPKSRQDGRDEKNTSTGSNTNPNLNKKPKENVPPARDEQKDKKPPAEGAAPVASGPAPAPVLTGEEYATWDGPLVPLKKGEFVDLGTGHRASRGKLEASLPAAVNGPFVVITSSNLTATVSPTRGYLIRVTNNGEEEVSTFDVTYHR